MKFRALFWRIKNHAMIIVKHGTTMNAKCDGSHECARVDT